MEWSPDHLERFVNKCSAILSSQTHIIDIDSSLLSRRPSRLSGEVASLKYCPRLNIRVAYAYSYKLKLGRINSPHCMTFKCSQIFRCADADQSLRWRFLDVPKALAWRSRKQRVPDMFSRAPAGTLHGRWYACQCMAASAVGTSTCTADTACWHLTALSVTDAGVAYHILQRRRPSHSFLCPSSFCNHGEWRDTR